MLELKSKYEIKDIVIEANAQDYAATIDYGEDEELIRFDKLVYDDFKKNVDFIVANAFVLYKVVEDNWIVIWRGDLYEED